MLSNKKKILWISLTIVAVLVIFRIALPFIVLRYANKTLANMNGYYGRIQDIDIALIRGAYKIDSVYINKVDSVTREQTPFFSASVIDLSIEWKALLHGSLVGEFVFEKPTLIFTKEKVEPSTLKKDSSEFKDLQDDFMPLRVNRFEVNNATIRYIDKGSKPAVDIAMTNAFIVAQNLRNSYDSSELLPATIHAHATVYGGTLTFNMKLNPLADVPTFDLNTELKNTNLVELNEFFQAYARVDVNKGTFGMYAEVAAKDGRFAGYVKPLIKNLDILGKEDRKDNIFQQMWEAIAGTVGEVFENQDKDQVATKVPFEGKIDNPDTNVWYAIVTVLRNAFIQALQPSIDQEINIASVERPAVKEKKTFLQKIFGKKDREKEKNKDKQDNKSKKKPKAK
jgi:hypothetical protein